jgi:hypothetical protein
VADESGSTGATPVASPTPEGATPDGSATDRRDAGGGSSDESLRDAGKEALDKERAARREAEKRAVEAERQLQSLQDAGKSELERAVARLDRQAAELEAERATRTQLEKRLAASELLELKRQVATELGVPLEAAHRLQGDDVRSLKADAQRYLEERKPAGGDLGVGRGGAAAARSGVDMNALIREAAGRG